MALIDDLINSYFYTDLRETFAKVGLDSAKINDLSWQNLKEVTLAQWLLESGRGTSQLAIQANNFAGLKWRFPDMSGFAEPLKIKVPSEPQPVEFCSFSDVNAFILGYWKFLTRSPYKGLEAYTNTPEDFLGFLRQRGYAADPNYVIKILNLLPEAQKLLADVAQIVIVPTLPTQLDLISAPQQVEVGQSLRIEGVAKPADAGRFLAVVIDERFPAGGIRINQDGKWQLNFVFFQAGDRQMRITIDDQIIDIPIKVVPMTPNFN